MKTIYTPSGNIDIEKTIDCIKESIFISDTLADDYLQAVIHAVWVEAYTKGWSDGLANRDPNNTDSPYK